MVRKIFAEYYDITVKMTFDLSNITVIALLYYPFFSENLL